jgi:murein DD-endopeptidase MepM/ murein hydrolase activator NlpD
MEDTPKRKTKFLKRLNNKYRLVVLNDETFEEISSIRLSRINLYIILSTTLVILVFVIASVIFYTPLKEYVPGYSDINIKRQLIQVTLKTDSFQNVILAQNNYLDNLRRVLLGSQPVDTGNNPAKIGNAKTSYDSIDLSRITPMESQMRQDVETDQKFAVNIPAGAAKNPQGNAASGVNNFYFFLPVKGYITGDFDPKNEHYGVDIVAPENAPVKATLDGAVIIASWTPETGYIIGIQHENNLISLYKHNSVLLKKEGDYVHAGDVIAIVGNTGELTTGPHLHFELWYNGIALNPKDYINFN